MKAMKKKFTPHLALLSGEISQINENFAALLEAVSTSHIKEGSVIKGQVIGFDAEVIIIDVGLKNEGRVQIDEFKSDPELPKIGNLVDVYVEKIEGRNGRTILSREKAVREDSWAKLEEACNKGLLVDGIIFGRVKGGFTVDVSGVIAFLPGSQVDVRPIKDISSLMHITQPFQILKMDKKLGNIVVSRRAILEESRSEARDEMLSKIKEGVILEGIVKNITDYGAFVDLGNVDGLLHVTDISWSRINHPSEVLALGQKIQVVVVKFNEETKRISLGMKQLDTNPWTNIQKEFPVGQVITGKVSNITDYGAFIELKDGIEGLVHLSEIGWVKSTQHPRKLLTIGQEVKFVILEIDPEKNRISLSIKQCQENPWTNFAAKYPIGTVITAPIRHITDFGLFVALDNNIDGMVHESDLTWDNTGQQVLKTLKKGDELECKILSIDVEKERVALGVKQLMNQAEPATESSDTKKNSVVTCEIVEVNEEGIEINFNDNNNFGFIKKTDLSSDKLEQKTERFAVGDRVDAKIISTDSKSLKSALSIRALEMDKRAKVIKEYGSTDSGATLGDILGAALNQKKD